MFWCRKGDEDKKHPTRASKSASTKKKTKKSPTGSVKKLNKPLTTPPKSPEVERSPVPSVGTPTPVEVSKETAGKRDI